jgi:hypothetical protein
VIDRQRLFPAQNHPPLHHHLGPAAHPLAEMGRVDSRVLWQRRLVNGRRRSAVVVSQISCVILLGEGVC